MLNNSRFCIVWKNRSSFASLMFPSGKDRKDDYTGDVEIEVQQNMIIAKRVITNKCVITNIPY
jgi:hypothetical protein